ncbi:hypothetical protein PHYBLDRAFT_71985 [Phycomyces blakesleeanus NRRL 1555(-)]|uniref:Uncharacterized protein n=1 Tax=Phycomyces blakesleeanus (strain ATCC 8743b / DSM 1359 / FGSC 10004 / NBRC 33097 / NRRL 1555) TaxID=763407 RepID=A0A163ARC7_PHYB8|nr:hypothetical protein PHYBLDRAFT_71985 [Phycomyces blakesleeanus NRRL 1555(-)]OAD75251.1 hypothetical protein PHYBLDRAFT_71985 [Phycomyces blakesleeanus NRRL 1555(-)]|eukprot:XP_018293291.1 hypothetical protein PHYBLDRAFT_71985 [Phycomyces blakesleeanus NRRL 1555(-)]
MRAKCLEREINTKCGDKVDTSFCPEGLEKGTSPDRGPQLTSSVRHKRRTPSRNIVPVDNVLPELESKERTLGFFESLGDYRFKKEIRMCKSLFYEFYKNLWILYEFCTFIFWCLQLQIDIIGHNSHKNLIDQSG